jgi:hypothetical protein
MSVSPEQPNANDDGLAVMRAMAAMLGVVIEKAKVRLDDGRILTHRVRAFHRGHQIELLADQELMLVDIEADYGQFTLFYINPRKRHSLWGEPIFTMRVADVEYQGFNYPGELTPEQSFLIESGTLRHLLEKINPQDGEEINISQRLVRVYLRTPNTDRVNAVICSVMDLMPHERASKERYAELPIALRPLIPLIPKWGISDDEERWQKIKRSRQSTRQKLVSAVIPHIPAVNQYLDSLGENPPLYACELGDVVQAALEAHRLLTEDVNRASD